MCQKSSLDNNPYKNPQTIEYTEVEKLLRENHKDIFLLQLLGGEPLYYSEIHRMIDLLHELKISYCMTTNGALLKKEIAEKIAGKCAWVSFSLDAADPHLYSYIRKGGSIHTISDNLKTLNKIKEKSGTKFPILNASSTLFTYNMNDLSNLLKFCYDHSVKSLSVSGGSLYNTPLVNQSHLVRNRKQEAIEAVEEAKKMAQKLQMTLRVTLRSLYGSVKRKKKRFKRTYDNCLDLYFEITIQPDLNVASAGEDYMYMGNLRQHSIYEIWNSEKLNYSSIRMARRNREY